MNDFATILFPAEIKKLYFCYSHVNSFSFQNRVYLMMKKIQDCIPKEGFKELVIYLPPQPFQRTDNFLLVFSKPRKKYFRHLDRKNCDLNDRRRLHN